MVDVVHMELDNMDHLRGKLLVIEGMDGSGKSTQVQYLREKLLTIGINPLILREPGATCVGERVRSILLDPDLKMTASTEVLLFCAARSELHDKVIEPALNEGRTILMDRWAWSTLAYQCSTPDMPIPKILSVIDLATGGRTPNLTIILDIDLEQRQDRLGSKVQDRIESKPQKYHEDVIEKYRWIAATFPAVKLVDARRSLLEVAKEIWNIVSDDRCLVTNKTMPT